MLKRFNYFALSSLISILPIATVACGTKVNTPEKTKQELSFEKKDAIKKEIEKTWLLGVVSKYYNLDLNNKNQTQINETLLQSQSFATDAYNAYLAYLAFESQKDNDFYNKELAKLQKLGLFNQNDLNLLQPQNITNNHPNMDQFKLLFKIDESDVRFNVLKNLLVATYFKINKKEELEKINKSDYDANKDNFDLNNFLLIDYLVKNQFVQLWQYKSSNADDIFTLQTRQISSINDYNNLAKTSYTTNKNASDDLLFFDASQQKQLASYVGILKNDNKFRFLVGKDGATSNIEILKNIANYSDLSGFYDPVNSRLVSVDANGNLSQAINISSDDKNIQVSFFNWVLPIGKTIEIDNPDKDKQGQPAKITKKIISFDATPFKDKIIKLSVLLNLSDSALYDQVVKAFLDLGYRVSVGIDDAKLKDSAKDSKFLG
ncbi:HinT-interacting membrane complex lipoprotein P60 [Mycoplasma sp. 6243]|uniref:HinT-interacting membrane complex lipoprotein P60 n=1 Tax=Mycoplasma sp. 6243 TaxID=3440865 RepID=UPI003EB9D5CE